ncbi:hypothetical protein [uncultured Enterococcus sp.]|nr:hypothetical protein [uncultured Enterococcus sp.]
MEIKQAVQVDNDIVMGLLKDTALWLKERGSSQWGGRAGGNG